MNQGVAQYDKNFAKFSLPILAQVSDVAKGPLVMTSGVYNIQNKIVQYR